MPVITRGERDFLSDPSILKEVPKKNFIRDNIKQLKQLERKTIRERKKSSELENEVPISTTRRSVGKSKSQVKFGRNRNIVESKSSKSIVKSLPKSPTTQVELADAQPLTKQYHHSKKSKAKVIHTSGDGSGGSGDGISNDSDEEEIIRKVYGLHRRKKKESKSHQTKVKSESPPYHETVESVSSFSPFNIDDIKREMKAVQDVDFVKLNQLVQYKPKNNSRNKADPNKAPPTYQRGVLPRYLRDTKKDNKTPQEKLEPLKEYPQSPVHHSVKNVNVVGQSENNKKSIKEVPKESSRETSCPPGHILLSESEKKQQLNELRRQYAELINKLYRIPNDKKHRQVKNELENELENLEASISLFSKEKLYVKIA